MTLVDKWVLENNGTFYNKPKLFLLKILPNFQKGVIKAEIIGILPLVSLIRNWVEEDGSMVYDILGFLVEYFLLSIKKMNITVVILPPSQRLSFEAVSAHYRTLNWLCLLCPSQTLYRPCRLFLEP